MSEQIVAQDEWSQLVFYDEWNTLELKWLPKTAQATDADVKTSMEAFANASVDRCPQWLIVDTTEFRHTWGEGMMEWRNQEIIPLYNKAGVSKLAFVAGEGFPGQTVESGAAPGPEGPAKFPTGWFKSREAAYQWLGS